MVFSVNFAKYLKASLLRSTSVWRLLFYNSYWLYTLQLHIAGNFQVAKSHWSGKNFIHIFKDFTDLDFFYTDFFHFLLRKMYGVLWAADLSQRRLNTMLLTNFKNSNSIVKFFQEAQARFLSFDGPTDYLHLSKNHWSWPGERPSSHLKVIKMWFGPIIKYLSEPFFADFCCWEGISRPK